MNIPSAMYLPIVRVPYLRLLREWSTRAQWFYGSIEDARTIHRLFGLLANFRFLLSFHSHKSAETTRRHSLEHPLRQEPQGFWHPSKILSFLTHMQNFSLLVCNPLEHAAWFASNILELPAEVTFLLHPTPPNQRDLR